MCSNGWAVHHVQRVVVLVQLACCGWVALGCVVVPHGCSFWPQDIVQGQPPLAEAVGGRLLYRELLPACGIAALLATAWHC